MNNLYVPEIIQTWNKKLKPRTVSMQLEKEEEKEMNIYRGSLKQHYKKLSKKQYKIFYEW